MITTLGRERVRAVLPDKYKSWADKPLDKKNIVAMTTQMALDDPDAYVETLQGLNAIGEDVMTRYGRDAALSYTGAAPSKKILRLRDQIQQLIDRVLDDDTLTEKQKERKIIDIGYKYTQKMTDAVFEDQDEVGSPLALQIKAGSRGNKTQLRQLMVGNMLMKDALNRDIPYIMMTGYTYGASPMGYWVSSMSGRKNEYDTQAATGKAGYLGKQVTNVTHDVTIEKEDCGTTDTGVPFKASDPDNVGAVLLRPFHNYPAGSVVTQKMIQEADDDEEMVLRSPITCKCRHGVCAKCNGLDENGRFPGVGEYVSFNAARSFVYPMTQAGIGSRHGAGIGGKRVENPEGEDQPTGFASIERMFKAQSTFPGGAVLAPVSGVVNGIKPAPQGGSYINVGTRTIYSPPARRITVHNGDNVDKGDALTNGVPNPDEVVDLKGLGVGRKYYVSKLYDILSDFGAGTNRRNLESFTRAALNKVRITDPDGFGDYLPGDVASYSNVAASYKPREDSVTTKPSQAIGKYLDAPVLNYTIGTQITGGIAKALEKYGFNEVTVNDKEPPFKSEFMRPAEALRNDDNWLPRLAGERLYDAVFDAARRGITDDYNSQSYVDRIVASPFK